jgi:hypothetical protein
MKVVLDYIPQPRQQLLHSATARQIFYGGAAGGGKSKALRWDGAAFCLRNPGCLAVLFRRTQKQLENNHIFQIRSEFPKEIGRFNETRRRFEFVNGSVLAFQHCEHKNDLGDIQGWEIHWAGLDEAALFEPEMIAFIKSRMRLGSWKPTDKADAKRLPRLALGSNPGGPAHTYLKNTFIKAAPPETLFYDETMRDPNNPLDKGWSSIFIPARMADNSYLDTGYAAAFSHLPVWQQKQLVEGDWDAVPGAFFECWSTKNVIAPFDIPENWLRFQALDWGFATPFSIGEYAVSDGEEIVNKKGETVCYPEGAMIRVWEWYGGAKGFGHGNVGLRRDASDVAHDLKLQRPYNFNYRVADESIWRVDSGPSVGEKFAREKVIWQPADRERIPGWQEMYRRIDHGMLLITSNCTAAIQAIPQTMADENKPEDVMKEGEDHVCDEIRYACMSRPWKIKKPPTKQELVQPLRFCDLKPIRTKLSYERRI